MPNLTKEDMMDPKQMFIEGRAPAILLAKSFDPRLDPTDWWMSEKLDGVRAIWNGEKFISRLGNAFTAPPWFIQALPKDVALDGELWGGRNLFQTTVSIVKSSSQLFSEDWDRLIYKIFDAPSIKRPFEERIAVVQFFLNTIKGRPGSKYVQGVDMVRVKSVEQLNEKLKEVEKVGGEGLMIREPGSEYVGARHSSLQKVKSFSDMEAVVIGYEKGRGKYEGKVGALVVQLENGKKFEIGSGLSDVDRADPPKLGAIVNFRYHGLTSDGVPRFPTYAGERIDVLVKTPEEKEAEAKKAEENKTEEKKEENSDNGNEGRKYIYMEVSKEEMEKRQARAKEILEAALDAQREIKKAQELKAKKKAELEAKREEKATELEARVAARAAKKAAREEAKKATEQSETSNSEVKKNRKKNS